jgi:TrmH family RNA methyltransferase
MPITFILYQTENAENLGSIARAASNFDFSDILLIDPKCRVSERSRWLAKHGLPTLESMRVVDEKVLEDFDILVMTHGRNATGHNLVRTPITPRELRERLAEIDLEHTKVGLLFGPEGEGLPVGLLERADIVCAIPTSRDNPSMNLAQSVTVFLYELSMLRGKENKITLAYRPMGKTEHDALLRVIDNTLDTMRFKTPSAKDAQRILWRRIVGRSFLTKKESKALLGFLKGMQHRNDVIGDVDEDSGKH